MAKQGDAETLFEVFGGRDGVAALVEEFYRRIEADPEIRPVYPEDLSPGKAKLKLFLEQWLGGPEVYSQKYGHPRLRLRHFPFVIDEKHAGLWLKHMREAMQARAIPDAAIRLVFERLAPLAKHMVNAHEDVPRETLGDVILN
jgi:hemoglobin